MTHYIVHYIRIRKQEFQSRNQYNRLSELYDSVKPLVEPLFNFNEGKQRVKELSATYPELEFELKSMGD